MNHARQQRFRFIDFLLDHYGRLNRAALEDYFGISTQQVSLDINAYLDSAPTNAYYDMSEKAYIRGSEFKRVFP